MTQSLTPVLLAVAIAGLTVGDHVLAASHDEGPPNILLIITDDQGYGDLSLHGNPVLKTPNLDRLGAESLRFDRFYVSPGCTPTRAALMTGRYWHRTGVWGVTRGRETMREGEVTIAEALKPAGYRTGMFGKWHLGEHYPHTPNGQGFDEFLGIREGHANIYFDAVLDRNGRPERPRGYIADVLTDAAIEFIARPGSPGQPFFCYLAYNTPHGPFQVPDVYFDRYKAMGLDNEAACIYGMCANIDDNVGRLLAKLDELGVARNTVVMFLTDNGPNTPRFNGGMRGYKSSPYEGGPRVPLFVRWPLRFKQPRVIETIADHIDLYPTILAMCGVDLPAGPPIDGVNLMPLMEGGATGWPDRLLFTNNSRGSDLPTLFPGSVRSGRYRLVNMGPRYELYDMLADPGQGRDIGADFPDVVREMSGAYERWFAEVTRGGVVVPPVPVGYEQENPVLLPAHRAELAGAVRFHGVNGFAHDWLVDWRNPQDSIEWDVDVVSGGEYEVEVAYSCPAGEAGSTIQIASDDGRSSRSTVPPAEPRPIQPPHRVTDAETKHRLLWYETMEWSTMPLGRLTLAKGRQKLTLTAPSIASPGGEVMWLKHVALRRLD